MQLIGDEPCPLPDDPVLAATARTLNDTGHWAEIMGPDWHAAYMTEDARRMYGGGVELAPYPLGAHAFSRESIEVLMAWRGGQFPLEINRKALEMWGPWMLADKAGGREELRQAVDARLQDIVDRLTPRELVSAEAFNFRGIYTAAGAAIPVPVVVTRLRNGAGQIVGTLFLYKPAVGMAVLARITALGDPRHFKRIAAVTKPGRRPAAIMFADLESSSSLARRLSTAAYFRLVRRLARAADQSVIDAGGLVGSHAGDGFGAFFLADVAGSESAAAAGCIRAARSLTAAIDDIAARSELDAGDVVMRFGLHWGANLYVGQITTGGRTEVTALGDQVNETARIEACATGGRALVSKDLIERLTPDDTAALGVDPEQITYGVLADLPTATEKARRDAPAIAVYEL
jgi:class 3 adenylate cyclase